jgi:hypothetical protein
MMKKFSFLFSCCLVVMSGYSQHYYNDLVVTGDIIRKQALYRSNQVKAVRFNSLDNNNQPIEGFSCNQVISNNFTELVTTTTTPLTGKDLNTAWFNARARLIKTVDTAEGKKTTITYAYDANDRITQIVSISSSPGLFFNKEEHRWFYTTAGKPEKMLKIKNNTDTTYFSFILDEKGNVGEERSTWRGSAQPAVYYYYDDHNRLTDIVRYNDRSKRLMPDYIFEYDEQGRMSSMMVIQLTPENTGIRQPGERRRQWFNTNYTYDYQKWYYTYDEKGLKEKDECYSKTKALIGKVEYKYQY